MILSSGAAERRFALTEAGITWEVIPGVFPDLAAPAKFPILLGKTTLFPSFTSLLILRYIIKHAEQH